MFPVSFFAEDIRFRLKIISFRNSFSELRHPFDSYCRLRYLAVTVVPMNAEVVPIGDGDPAKKYYLSIGTYSFLNENNFSDVDSDCAFRNTGDILVR